MIRVGAVTKLSQASSPQQRTVPSPSDEDVLRSRGKRQNIGEGWNSSCRFSFRTSAGTIELISPAE